MGSHGETVGLAGLAVILGVLSLSFAWLFAFPWEHGTDTRLLHMVLTLAAAAGSYVTITAIAAVGGPPRPRERWRPERNLTRHVGLVCRERPSDRRRSRATAQVPPPGR